MKIKKQCNAFFIVSCIAIVLFSASCHSNDYDTSDNEPTTVSPSHEMHMTPPADHSIIDSSHMLNDTSHMMHDTTMMHEQHP